MSYERLARASYWAIVLPGPSIRPSVAEADPAARHELFRRLARDNAAVRLYLATNPDLPLDVLESLLNDGNIYVRGAAAAHRSAPPEALARMAAGMDEAAWTLRAIAANRACPPDLSDQLLTWLALGGAGSVDARFDPILCAGHPGVVGTNVMQWYLTCTRRDGPPRRLPARCRPLPPGRRPGVRSSVPPGEPHARRWSAASSCVRGR